MSNLDKVKEYMSLCGITVKKQLMDFGEYPSSYQYLCKVLDGTYKMNQNEEKKLYNAINRARAYKLMNKDDKSKENDKQEN